MSSTCIFELLNEVDQQKSSSIYRRRLVHRLVSRDTKMNVKARKDYMKHQNMMLLIKCIERLIAGGISKDVIHTYIGPTAEVLCYPTYKPEYKYTDKDITSAVSNIHTVLDEINVIVGTTSEVSIVQQLSDPKNASQRTALARWFPESDTEPCIELIKL